MTVIGATEDLEPFRIDDDPPLVQAMVRIATRVVNRIVVRAPAVLLLEEREHTSEDGSMHELVARTGMLLRGPFALLRRTWRPRAPMFMVPEPGASVKDWASDGPASHRPRRA